MNNKLRLAVDNHTFKSLASKRNSARSIFIARVLLVLLFFSTLLPAHDSMLPDRVMADGGGLIPSFGTNGFVSTDFFGGHDTANAIAATPRGKIIAAGSA